MRVILCTCPPADAERIAQALVDAGAACVNILPAVRSVYRWKGAVQNDAETLLIIKANPGIVRTLEEKLKGVHPYELPEWVVLSADEALTSRAYRQWVMESAHTK